MRRHAAGTCSKSNACEATVGAFRPDQEAQRDPCAPVLPAKLTHVELQGDIAWVEVIEGEPPVRRVRFYRQTERGWVHTAPRESFWGKEVTLRSGPIRGHVSRAR